MRLVLLGLLFICFGAFHLQAVKKNEDYYNRLFCKFVGGSLETRYSYKYETGSSYVKIDCETSEEVIEGGMDKRSSLDSVQQALFFSSITGKKPAVVIYDRDGRVGKYEHRIREACRLAGVKFYNLSEVQISK